MGFNARRFKVQIQQQAEIKTGRCHQIRKHFAHLRHPVINDPRHGDVKHNKYFRENFGLTRLLLHAQRLSLRHPATGQVLHIDAEFARGLGILGMLCPASSTR